jgi:hypothetical protein
MPHRRDIVLGCAAASVAMVHRAYAEGGVNLYLPSPQTTNGQPSVVVGDPRQLAAMRGDEATATDVPAPVETIPLDLTNGAITEAVDFISTRAKGRQIVILNEAHNVSRCRSFGQAVALRLRAEGFDTFAAETFVSVNGKGPLDLVAANGPITSEVGYYTRDPVFAEFIRAVRASGYKLASYEIREEQIPTSPPTGRALIPIREQSEAENLALVLKANPSTRVFVYCGYSHASKAPINNVDWMALRLFKLTGIEPLTIEQSYGWPALKPSASSPVEQVLEAYHLRRPSALHRPDGSPIILHPDYRGGFDIQIVHPRQADTHGRPGWLASAAGRRKVEFNLPERSVAGSLVQAVRMEEVIQDAGAIPTDQYPLGENQRLATFYLPKGRYQVRVEVPGDRRVVGEMFVA